MRGIHRLTAVKVDTVKKPGLYADGGGLWLRVKEGSGGPAKSWLFRYAVNGKDRWCGLGATHTVTLAEAREFARQARHLRLNGEDPIENKRATKSRRAIEAAKSITFKECADEYLRQNASTWRSAQHGHDWAGSLKRYAYPVLADLQVKDIDVTLVLKVLEPLWEKRTVTAARLRGRIENVLAWATVRGYRAGDNPARWTGHLQQALPEPRKVAPVEHLASMPYSEIAAFMAELRGIDGVVPRALEFAILTACRSGEILGARWAEIDLKARVWTIPAARTKANREHIVPLSDRAVEILEGLLGDGEVVFPGPRSGGESTNRMSLRALLVEHMGRKLTVHGFRSSFRTWVAEQTNFPREVAEAALGHVNGDKVEASYQRGKMVERRRELMEAWSRFCAGEPGANVLSIEEGKKKLG